MVNTNQTNTQVKSGEVVSNGSLVTNWAGRQFDALVNGNTPVLGFALVGAAFLAVLFYLGLGWLIFLAAGLYLLYRGLRSYPRTRQINSWLVGAGALVTVGAIVNAFGLTLPILAATLFAAGIVLIFRQYRNRIHWPSRAHRVKP